MSRAKSYQSQKSIIRCEQDAGKECLCAITRRTLKTCRVVVAIDENCFRYSSFLVFCSPKRQIETVLNLKKEDLTMSVKFRLRGPDGTLSTIIMPNTSTIGELQSKISESLGLSKFDLKIGYPPRPLDLNDFSSTTVISDTNIKLNGEQLIANSIKPPSQPASSNSRTDEQSRSQSETQPKPVSMVQNPSKSSSKPNETSTDPPELAFPSRGATMVLRVMPDDNSCLFRALGSVVLTGSLDAVTELRSLCATTIASQPDIYTSAILDKPPAAYCQWINSPSSWGGAIELGILATHFELEIASINVQDGRIDRFNEGASNRCLLVYSGIHYDTIALSPSEPPHKKADLDAEFDVKMFESADEEVLYLAMELCRKLREKHYFTDTAGFKIRCGTCGWEGKGEKEATQHAKSTGHYALEEVST